MNEKLYNKNELMLVCQQYTSNYFFNTNYRVAR